MSSPIVVSVGDGGCGVGSDEAAETVTVPPQNHISVFATLIFSPSDKIILFL